MWLLQFVPDWIFWSIAVFSTIAVTTGISQPWRNWNFLAVIFCVAYLTWFSGQRSWQEKLHILEQQAAITQQKSATANTEIQTKVVTKIKKVKETEYVNRDIIQQVVVKELDSSCILPQSAVVLHDSASQNAVATGAVGVVGTTSTVKASELLETVVVNYAACYDSITRLEAWQTWYKTQKQIYEQQDK
jgi:hypothetical protein